jgi:hypothetical protein
LTAPDKFSKLTWRKAIVPHTRGLTATQLRVLDVVFNHTNAEGKNAHPSQATIAEMVGVSERQVRRVLGELQARGLIECVSRGSSRRREASVYELRLPDTASDEASITGHGLPDIAGHPEPDYRTSEELLPDIQGVRPSDPDPSDPDRSDPVLKASIFDDRRDASRSAEEEEHNDDGPEGADRLEAVPFGTAEADTGVSALGVINHPTEGTPPMSCDPFSSDYDPFGHKASVSHSSWPSDFEAPIEDEGPDEGEPLPPEGGEPEYRIWGGTTPWPADKPLPRGLLECQEAGVDLFTTFVDEETGVPLTTYVDANTREIIHVDADTRGETSVARLLNRLR